MPDTPSLFTPETIPVADLNGRKVTVMGLGLFGGGRGLTEFLCRAGAEVTVTDLRPAADLLPSMEPLERFPIRWVLGGHRDDDFLGADLVFVNPAVPHENGLLARCRARGVPLETAMNYFFKLCRGRICGITGSNGKTTTTALTGRILQGAFPSTRVGGNIGGSLLGDLDAIASGDWVVLEISSFQLDDLRAIERRPEISLVTNLSPNHLNRHGTYENYIEAKRVILEGDPGSRAVLNGDDTRVRSWAAGTRRAVTFYGRSGGRRPRARGVWVEEDRVLAAEGGAARELFERADLALLGRFNLVNAAGAAAAALEAGCPEAAIRAGVRAFRPVEHRLEFAGRIDSVDYYNDSIATTPESTLCCIDALGPNLVLILGGSEKGSSFRDLGRAVARRTRGAVLIGQTAPKIEQAIRDARPRVPLVRADSLEEAVEEARRLARPGDRVALSPACASFDMFVNFQARGRRFKELVEARR